jgi:hypothetical protein
LLISVLAIHLRELATPGILAVMAPIAVGFGLGVGALGAYLAGAIGTGTLMAVFLSNSGGAWDNAKKMVEDGNYGGKGSDAHAATIVGDTVGDPFKDTAGPAINPLIKVMNLGWLVDYTCDCKFRTSNSAINIVDHFTRCSRLDYRCVNSQPTPSNFNRILREALPRLLGTDGKRP